MKKLTIFATIMSIMFFLSGIHKFKNIESKATYLKSHFLKSKKLDFKYYKFFIVCAAILQLVGSIVIVLCTTSLLDNFISNKNRNIIGSSTCLAIVAFTIAASLIFHYPPKNYVKNKPGKHYYAFISNVTTIGGFLLLADNIYNQ